MNLMSVNNVESLNWEKLPGGLRCIKDIVGAAAALALSRRFGGKAVYIPHSMKDEHQVAKCIGSKAALALVRIYGGDKIEVPKIDSVQRQYRANKIKKEREQGASISELATRFSLSRRRIQQLLTQ